MHYVQWYEQANKALSPNLIPLKQKDPFLLHSSSDVFPSIFASTFFCTMLRSHFIRRFPSSLFLFCRFACLPVCLFTGHPPPACSFFKGLNKVVMENDFRPSFLPSQPQICLLVWGNSNRSGCLCWFSVLAHRKCLLALVAAIGFLCMFLFNIYTHTYAYIGKGYPCWGGKIDPCQLRCVRVEILYPRLKNKHIFWSPFSALLASSLAGFFLSLIKYCQ